MSHAFGVLKTCRTCGVKKLQADFPKYGYGSARRRDCLLCWSRIAAARRFAIHRTDKSPSGPESVAVAERALRLLRREIVSGRIAKPPACQDCEKQTPILDAHHPDYSEPLSIIWLCRRCHRLWHRSPKK